MIDYLRESAATYIYSNSISPGTAGAALAAVQLLDQPEGEKLLEQSRQNVQLFKELMKQANLQFAVDSTHPIQPLLIGDPAKTKALKAALYEMGILVTSINYPVVPKGRDEIRIQISAAHTPEDVRSFAEQLVLALN
jgi:glycine C-acetyltransferase